MFAWTGRAYTLVELVLVMAIMAVIAGIAAPRFGESIARQRADGAASRIVSDLTYARAVARMTSAAVSVTFDPAHNKYTMPTAADPLRNTAAPYVVDLSASPYRATIVGGVAAAAGATLPGTGSTGGTFSITFDGFGEPSTTGWVVVRAGGWSRQISMDAAARTTITRLSDSEVRALLP